MTAPNHESPIIARWGQTNTGDPNNSEGLLLKLAPEIDPTRNSKFTADFENNDEGLREVIFLGLFVDPSVRQQGHGQRMLSALTHLTISRGVESLHGSVESDFVLRAIGRLFDESRITITDVDYGSGDYNILELPMTLDQAVESLARAGTHEENLEEREYGLGVYINLRGLSASDFEQPVVVNEPPGILRWQ